MRFEWKDERIHLSSVELFAADHCNMRCWGCAASSPFMRDPNFPDPDRLARTLARLEPVLRATQLKILGGEPLLNRDLATLLRTARQSGLFERLRLTTNGLLLERTTDELWQLVDVVEISVYPDRPRPFTPTDRAHLQERAARLGTTLEINEVKGFFTAIADSENRDPDLVQRVFAACHEAQLWPSVTIYQDHLYRCSRVHTLDRYLDRLGVAHRRFVEEDGLLIDDRPHLRQALQAYLERGRPLGACSFCYGTSGNSRPQTQIPATAVRLRVAGQDRQPFDASVLRASARSRFVPGHRLVDRHHTSADADQAVTPRELTRGFGKLADPLWAWIEQQEQPFSLLDAQRAGGPLSGPSVAIILDRAAQAGYLVPG
jgi:cyclic pyranopterin phosphate synthase